MNKAGFGIVVLALLAVFPEVAVGQKEKQIPQKEKQIPQAFLGTWCDTGNEGANLSIQFRRINNSEDCKTKQVLELTTDFLNLYNSDAETKCFLIDLDSVVFGKPQGKSQSKSQGSFQGKFVCATRNYEAKRTYTTQEVYELAFERDETLRFRDMQRAGQK
ncbi:MAG TPA: hypothetical protein VE843_00620 [Ktedonobacteraceae bacterium]|nr:hypothetical protein [Ktedonobacteraceae bacterium]